MTLEELLAELSLDPDFAALPPEWQQQLASEVLNKGLASAATFGAGTPTPTLTLDNLPQYTQYFPEQAMETARRAGLGDNRDLVTWARAHAASNPGWLPDLQRRLAEALPSTAGAFSGSAEQNAALQRWRSKASQYTGDGSFEDVPLEQDLLDQVVRRGYEDMAGDDARRAWAENLIAQYDPFYEYANQTLADLYNGEMLRGEQAASAEAARAQQDALDRSTGERRTNLDTETAAHGAALADLIAAREGSLADASTSWQDALDKFIVARQGGLDTQMETRRAALADALQQLYSDQDAVSQARLDAADAQATAINLAGQSERDRIMAGFARDGYVGGSTGTDAALARTSIGARQGAAGVMGEAKLGNALDLASIGRYKATEGRGLEDYGAAEQRGLTDTAATDQRTLSDYLTGERRTLADFGAGERRTLADYAAGERRGIDDFASSERRGISDAAASRNLSFFSNDIQRRLDNLTKPQTLINSRLALADTAGNFGQTGFNRFMTNLNYFRTNGGNAPMTQPFQEPVNDVTGSALQNVGAGLVGVAGSIGNANNWWQPKTPTTYGTWKAPKTNLTAELPPVFF